MELLNLDDILVAKRQIEIGGKAYDVADQSVGQMISQLQLQKQLENQGDEVVLMNQIVESVQQIIPDCPAETINKLPMRGINAIFEFANASDKEVIENSSEENSEGEPVKK